METGKDETDRLNMDVPKTLDTILIEAVGQFGRYQLRMILLAGVLGVFTAFSAMEYVFTTGRISTRSDSEYEFAVPPTKVKKPRKSSTPASKQTSEEPARCLVPECEASKTADFSPPWILNALPARDGIIDSCCRFKPDDISSINGSCPAEWFNRNLTIACSEYLYENTNTIVYDYDLACDEWRRTFIGAVRTFGGLLAMPITGYISDRWGRRLALVINAGNTAWLGIARYWCSSYYGFIIAELFKAMLGGGVFSCTYILVIELVGPKYRVAASAAFITCFSFGFSILGLIAWNIPNWRHFTFVIYIPHFLFLSYYWIMPESIRWNMTKGRYKAVKNFLEKVARVNKRELTEELRQELKETMDTEEKLKLVEEECKTKEPWLIVSVFQNKEILKRCCIAPIWWISSTLIYYGMSINFVNMSGNQYLNLMMVAASEIPGYWLALLLMDRIGRKPVLIGAFWMCAACQLVYICLPIHMDTVSLCVYLVGKFSIAIVLMSNFIYTAEIFPTQHRHSLMAFCGVIGNIGSIAAPLTPAFGLSIWHHFPSALFCGFALAAGASLLLTPETLGTKLPDTMAEAAEIGARGRRSSIM